MFKLPFGALPGHWGLAGKTREIAQAEYELEGYDLERRLLEIRKDDLDEKEYNRKLIDLDFKHGKTGNERYQRQLIELMVDEKQKVLATLELDLREGKIKQLEYDKAVATAKGEPWVNIVNMDFTKKSSLEGSFELDWNEHFVEKLKVEGYQGASSDAIVNQWFMELCRNIAMEEFDGTGDFTADSAANLETMKRWNSPESLPQGRKGHS